MIWERIKSLALSCCDNVLSTKLSGSKLHNYFDIRKYHITKYLYMVQGAGFYIETLAPCTIFLSINIIQI